jgi:hypothetical protein
MGRSGASELVFEDTGDLLLRAGTPVKVVSERLGHSSPNITLIVYAHVMPGMQREAADTFAALVSWGADQRAKYQTGIRSAHGSVLSGSDLRRRGVRGGT